MEDFLGLGLPKIWDALHQFWGISCHWYTPPRVNPTAPNQWRRVATWCIDATSGPRTRQSTRIGHSYWWHRRFHGDGDTFISSINMFVTLASKGGPFRQVDLDMSNCFDAITRTAIAQRKCYEDGGEALTGKRSKGPDQPWWVMTVGIHILIVCLCCKHFSLRCPMRFFPVHSTVYLVPMFNEAFWQSLACIDERRPCIFDAVLGTISRTLLLLFVEGYFYWFFAWLYIIGQLSMLTAIWTLWMTWNYVLWDILI